MSEGVRKKGEPRNQDKHLWQESSSRRGDARLLTIHYLVVQLLVPGIRGQGSEVRGQGSGVRGRVEAL